MQEGGQYRFTMPQKLAFGDGPPPPGFPKDSTLTFDVRVRKIVRGGAAMMQQTQRSSSSRRSRSNRRCPATTSGPSSSRSRLLLAEIDQHHLQRREDRVGEQHAEDPEQRAHQQLHREHQRRARGRPSAARCTGTTR